MKLTKILSIQRIFLKFYHNYRNKLYIFMLLALYPSIKFEIFTYMIVRLFVYWILYKYFLFLISYIINYNDKYHASKIVQIFNM